MDEKEVTNKSESIVGGVIILGSVFLIGYLTGRVQLDKINVDYYRKGVIDTISAASKQI